MNFTMPLDKFIKDTVPPTVCSTTAGVINYALLNSTTVGEFSGKPFGDIFNVTVRCTTGIIYIGPNDTTTELTSTNGYPIEEDETLTLRVKNYLQLVGNSTTAAFAAIIWKSEE